MLRNGTSIKHVKLDFSRDSNTADKAFKSEVKFLTGMKAKHTARMEEYRELMNSCDPTQMFNGL